jgi:quinol monooxygenase YgiN
MVKVALWVMLEARPGKEADVEKFLQSALPLVEAEPQTITWYALRLGPGKYGIFDTFNDDAGRQAHLTGKVAEALMANAGALLAKPPTIEKIDLLTAKVPG